MTHAPKLSSSLSAPSRRARFPALAAIGGVAALTAVGAIALGGCASTVRKQIYAPQALPQTLQWGGPAPQTVQAITSDQLALRGYYWPAQGQNDLIVYFQGRDGNAYDAARAVYPLTQGGHGLLVASYRGYGSNPGTPNEHGLYSDGVAFLTLARQLAPGAKIYLFGFSLGGAVALELAARAQVDGVVTLGTFTTLGKSTWLPAAVLPDHYDNRKTISYVEESVLVLHGDKDKVVPVHDGKMLAQAGPHTRLIVLTGAAHQVDMTTLAPIIWRNIAQMPYPGGETYSETMGALPDGGTSASQPSDTITPSASTNGGTNGAVEQVDLPPSQAGKPSPRGIVQGRTDPTSSASTTSSPSKPGTTPGGSSARSAA